LGYSSVKQIGDPDKLLYMRKPFDAEELAQVALSLNQKWNISYQQRRQNEKIASLLHQLENTKDYLDSIVNSMPSMIIGVNEQGIVSQWNWQAEKITNTPTEKACGQFIEDLLPLTGMRQQINETITRKHPQSRTKFTTNFGFGDVLVDITVYPLIKNDIKDAIIRVDDVTARVKMEEVAVQSDKMLSVGGLAAGIAHEINTPLGSIMQNAQILCSRFSTSSEKNRVTAEECGTDIVKINEYMIKRGFIQLLDGIRDSGSRTSKIVKSMLAFSHESNTMSQVYIKDLANEAITLARSDYDLKKSYRIKDFDIQVECDDELTQLNCERIKIEQVLLNLIKNAAQAMTCKPADYNPQITIRIRKDELYAYIEVEDNGPGLDEDVRKRLFEPFFTTKIIGQGTGLGLSLAYFIISENHKGNILVESELNKGTKFTLQLPFKY